MKKLLLIGNGFDLAHGLKTKYEDFILWFINKSMNGLRSHSGIENELLSIMSDGIVYQNHFNSIGEFLRITTANRIDIKYNHEFIHKLINDCVSFQWVDIESKYYYFLVNLYKKVESRDFVIDAGINSNLQKLHSCFSFLKEQLNEYLTIVESSEISFDGEIAYHFNHENITDPLDLMILNFNYTSTIEKYIKHTQCINYIHGKLNDASNPLIFGYGDEADVYYEKIERLNSNEFLRNFKSFGYFKNQNYQKLSTFLDSGVYEVYIMGHSCGLSDRVLLNSMFQHKNCSRIKIFYYQKDEVNDDFIEKTQEISRHFTYQYKNKMRNTIVPKSDSCPLKKYKK